MSAPISNDDNDSEPSKYAPPRFREQLRMPAAQQLHVTPTVRSSTDLHRERETTPEYDSWPERIPEPPPRSEDRTSSLFVRFSPMIALAAVVALGIVTFKPVVQGVSALFGVAQPSKQPDRTADAAPSNGRGDRLAANAPATVASVTRPAPALVPQPAPVSGAQPAPASVAQPAQPSPAQTQQASLAPNSG